MSERHITTEYFEKFPQAQPNRKGRARGTRSKLAQRFFEDVYSAWEEQGESVLARAAFQDPMAFARMVAQLMPQKIEISTPTDGMTDDRLAELLEFAERMAGLKAEQARVITVCSDAPALAHNLTNENADLHTGFEVGGGGPLREMGGVGENTSNTLRHTGLPTPTQVAEKTHPSLPAEPGLVAPAPQELPYPVGPATRPADAVVERRNLARLEPNPEDLF